MDIVYLLILGTVIGLLSSLIGIGGGIVIVPMLPIVFAMPQKEAIATSLLTICLITLFNTINYYFKNLLNVKVVLKLIIISSIGSYAFAK
ncbi:TSUP family transporter, partial [bacterium]|nr:TSUP family transporter [bacterium]